MTNILDHLPGPLKALWDVEAELRTAAQNALFLRNDEAKQHLEEARRHLQEALRKAAPAP